METVTKETVEPDNGSTSLNSRSLLGRLNLPFLLTAILTGFLALSNDSWWTVGTAGSGSILTASVSPFSVHINGLGVPNTVPGADLIGTVARIGLGLASVALVWQSFFPLSLWRKTVFWSSMSSLAGVFLCFALLLHSTRLILLQQYGVAPTLAGDSVIPGVVLGTDLVAYASPTITSSLSMTFLVGLVGFLVLGGSELAGYLFGPRFRLDVPGLMTGLTGAFLSPPYQHAWLTSNDSGLNPLGQDPDRLTDDQLALSFEKLLRVLQPGALVSVILPPWATRLGNRLVKIVSWTGFDLENSQVIFRSPGRAENELVFRKPAVSEHADMVKQDEQVEPVEEQEPMEAPKPPQWGLSGDLDNSMPGDEDLTNDLYEPGVPRDTEGPHLEEQIEEPVWAQPELAPQELAIVTSAVKVIERTAEPVEYKGLIMQVYMDLVDREINFESVKQIEEILVQHAGREVSIFDQLDQTGANVVKYWWLGESAVQTETRVAKKLRGKLFSLGKRVRRVKGAFAGHRRSRSKDEPERTVDDASYSMDY